MGNVVKFGPLVEPFTQAQRDRLLEFARIFNAKAELVDASASDAVMIHGAIKKPDGSLKFLFLVTKVKTKSGPYKYDASCPDTRTMHVRSYDFANVVEYLEREIDVLTAPESDATTSPKPVLKLVQ